MPKAEEVAEIEVDGKAYRDWTTVRCSRSFGSDLAAVFEFSAVERRIGGQTTGVSDWSSVRLKPGDQCKIKLGGAPFLTGFISDRQVSFNAHQKGILIQGGSRTLDVAQSSAPVKDGEYKNYTFDAIARKVLQPYGIGISIRGDIPGLSRPFDLVRVQPGETSFAQLDRLIRARSAFLVDTPDGNIEVRKLSGEEEVLADFQEGRNILTLQCVMSDQGVFSRTVTTTPRTGSDNVFGTNARAVSAETSNPGMTRHRPLYLVSERRGDTEDMKARAERQVDEQIGSQVACTVAVQGWFRTAGKLWEVGDNVRVLSPMTFPNSTGGQQLAIKTVTFQQSDGGTTTVLDLVLPQHLGAKGRPQIEGSPSNPFTPPEQPAKPAAPDASSAIEGGSASP